jgi:uncharacterized repeat protein (TIGR03803 family)
MKLLKALTLTVCILTPCLVAPRARAQATGTLTVLHSFGITNQPPENPVAPVMQGPDGTLYGTTPQGGINNFGTVFKVQTNGTGLTVLKYFTNSPDGASPHAGLVLSGNTLYGTTSAGGTTGNGTVFAVNTDGTGYTNLYSFQGGNDAARPDAGLVLSGGTLFGTTYGGGLYGGGTVFAIHTDGTGYTNLYSFQFGGDGGYPIGDLALSGNTLYGTAEQGGNNGNGTVFKINTDGTGYTNLYTFSALVNNTNFDGAAPLAALLIYGGTLYGTANAGGTGGSGTIFAINTDGTGFTNLYSFSATTYTGQGNNFTNSDGAVPTTPLFLSGGTLYGTTSQGGQYNNGTLFNISTNGTGFTVVHTFTGNSDGSNPSGLSLSDGTLFGATYHGGSSSGDGVIFSIATNSTVLNTIYSFANLNLGDPQAGVVLVGGTLYGTTEYGGTYNNGMVFAVNTNGMGYTVLHSFSALVNNTNSDGVTPLAGLVFSGGMLYGTANAGGAHGGNGTIFAVSTNGTGFTVVHTFTGDQADGRFPVGGLIISGSTLYGTAQGNGSGGHGTVFSVDTSGSPFTVLHSFSGGSDGAEPSADLILSNNMIYGTTVNGGTGGNGTIFAVSTSGSTYANLYSFSAFPSSDTNYDGANPFGGLAVAGGTLYGISSRGGGSGGGTLFSIGTNGTGFNVLHSFTQNDYPGFNDSGGAVGDLILSGNTLYGIEYQGSVFTANTNGANYTIVYELNGTTDGNYTVAGLALSGSTLYGTSVDKGAGGNGTVFALSLPVILTNIVVSPVNSIIGVSSNEQFTATGYFQFTPTQTLTSNLTWVSSSSAVATINNNGLATGLASGTTTITAISGTVSNSTFLTVVAPPAISLQPTNITVSPNGSVTLNVSATGGDLSYQWQLNGNNIAGATGATYQIPNVTSTNIGVYTVIVSNLAGSTTSQAAIVGDIAIQLFAGVIVNGPIGSNYLIQATSNLLSGWTTLTNVALPSQPYIYIDYSSPTNRQQFYRAVPQ